jgi:hypothetical protein
MCVGLPGVVLLVVSFPTKFVRSSSDFDITNLTVKVLTTLSQCAWESIAWNHLRVVKIHSIPDQNRKWPCIQRRFVVLPLNFCWTSLYFCQVHPYQWWSQMRWVWNHSSSLGLCPSVVYLSVSDLLGHCHTSPGDVHRVLVEDQIRFLFC